MQCCVCLTFCAYFTVNEGGIFGGKSFVFYGFNDDGIPVLSSFIKENGGKFWYLFCLKKVISLNK
jgi:hypothetical protein